jgi:biopolymer transport protein ExbD
MPFKKKKKDPPTITTASLPDIVFMLLCFFMVVTKMRDSEVFVKTTLPNATELQKLEDKTLLNYIHIGAPTKQYADRYGTAPRIQLDDAFATPQDIAVWVEKRKANNVSPENHNKMIAAMRIDKDVKMGLITEVKTELRKINLRKVSYLAGKRN